jgi:hypothetical protein
MARFLGEASQNRAIVRKAPYAPVMASFLLHSPGADIVSSLVLRVAGPQHGAYAAQRRGHHCRAGQAAAAIPMGMPIGATSWLEDDWMHTP